MHLKELRRNYDAVFSLGCTCVTATQLKRAGLRKESGPFDWMYSYGLSHINKALRNEFNGYMQHENLVTEGLDYHSVNYLVRDDEYGLVSAHDFSIQLNTPTNLVSYPEFRERTNRRTERLLERMQTSESILFVRVGGEPEEIIELEQILQDKVKGDFALLVVNYAKEARLWYDDYNLPHTCVVQFPAANEVWKGNNFYWDTVFYQMKLV
ncbi:peptidase [Paenibacillus sp. HN-1]|uniref:DUF1796 family putative cysteine peptidase n=1 Tax=Paenibacillus TaxID=44249 RepID=UPI001CA9FDE7|nr:MULTISPECIES: DUF1796 family putative cysteine peptidase [Paenibacillus]MBY9079506.1 peptidase [Paenibacillus sp. CGMCC 1.18879]MBY9085595.1 peptidase [Paenibacillus sinensis]